MGEVPVILDASALLAFLRKEPGMEVVARHLVNSSISTVNLSEVISKCVEYGGTLEEVETQLRKLPMRAVPFEATHAREVAILRPLTQPLNFSFADRACLATAKLAGLTAVTAERKWATVDVGVKVLLIRHTRQTGAQ